MASIRLLKSTWWQVTAYGDNMEKLDKKINVPSVVANVFGGIEKCPTSGRLHYQGAIQCATQCRGGVILNWIPGAHIEKANNRIATKLYAMKQETAVAEKTEWKNPEEYLTMDKALDKLAHYVPELNLDLPVKKQIECEYWGGVSKMIEENPSLIGLYSQPQMYRAWDHTRGVWLKRAKSIVLRPPPVEGPKDSLQETSGDSIDEENLYD